MKKVYKLSIIAMLLLLSLPCRVQISSIIAEATPQFSNDSGIVRYCCNWTRRKVVPIIVAPTHIEPSLYHQESPVYTTNGRRVNPQITPINILCNQ